MRLIFYLKYISRIEYTFKRIHTNKPNYFMPIPLVLIHGYSDKGESFQKWKDILTQTKKYNEDDIHICSYRSLTNEVTIKDIAEGFDRALRINTNIKPDEPFDAMVHSTGMLVLRSWFAVYGHERRKRIKRIIAIAPATFGSPLAHKGRSWLGSIFKGNREGGPDFMEAGDLVLDGLELGSRFTWDLAHRDLLNTEIFYGPHDDTPYVFTFCGNKQYQGLRGAITNAPGTDGTVRWSGCTLNTRKITLDFTKPADEKRYDITDWSADERINLSMPFIPVEGLNHASIIENPSIELVEMVEEALEVDSKSSYLKWVEYATRKTASTLENMNGTYQQFVVHARDERGDPINDYNLQLYKTADNKGFHHDSEWLPVKIDVHSYSTDNSYRCFHINLRDIMDETPKGLKLEFMASSGTQLLGYLEYIAEDADITQIEAQPTFTMDLSKLLNDTDFKFFYPYTTTLIEIILNREPLPLRDINKVTWFLRKENQ
jgi:hypothetical protein